MTFGFGSEIVDTLLYTELSALTAVTAAVGTNIMSRAAIVQGDALPALGFYPEQSSYGPPAFGGDNIGIEVLRYTVVLTDSGTSTNRIHGAALAQRQHLNGSIFNAVHASQNYQVTFEAQGAVPMTTVTAGADIYRRLGTVYSVHVALGG